MPERFGEQFLHKRDPNLHTSEPVEHEQERKDVAGETTSQKPAEKIADFLSVIEKTHMGHRENPEVLVRIKQYYHKKHVIKFERDDHGSIILPESYLSLQRRIIVNEGRGGDFEKDEQGEIIIPDEVKERFAETIITDQKASLDKWINYLTSPEADVYPMWAKYWAFRSVTDMGKLEKKEDKDGNITAQFKSRTKDTVSPFPILNPRAFALVAGSMNSYLAQKQKPKKERGFIENQSTKLSDEQFQKLLSSEKFSKLYAQFLVELPEYSEEGLKEVRGKWVVYREGDAEKLVKSLDGHPLEWCIANVETAAGYLQAGDIHVYYSIDDEGNAIKPRLAIRFEGDKIAEPPRGIAPDQNLDPYINQPRDEKPSVLEEKLKEFGAEGEAFKKRSEDMRQLTVLTEKTKNNELLTKHELEFLYELNAPIEGFGYQKDPRIEELRSQRNLKEDAPIMLGVEPQGIAWSQEDISKSTKVYIGPLFGGIFETEIEKIYTKFPEAPIAKFDQKVGGQTAAGLEKELKRKAGFNQSSSALDILKTDQFEQERLKEETNLTLIRLKVRDLGFASGATTDEIYQKATTLGLKLCPPDVGPALRLQYTDQPMGEWLLVGMKSIPGRDGSPRIFGLARHGGRLWLESYLASPDGGWDFYREFVFCFSKLESLKT